MGEDSNKRPTIGVLAGWQAYGGTLDTFLSHIFRGILAAAQERGCHLLLACGIGSPRDVGLGRPAWPMILPTADFVPVGPWNADGLLVIPPLASAEGSSYFGELVAKGYPLVFAGTQEMGLSVTVDHSGGIRQAVAHLVAHGHRRIAFIAGRKDRRHVGSAQRLAAYKNALQEMGLPSVPGLIAYGSHTTEGGRLAMEQLLRRGLSFTAVVASNDESAVGAMDALKAHGRLIPQDVAVIGFDDRLEARAQSPPLTTIRNPMFELGYRSLILLLDRLRGDASALETVRVPTRLIVRESCGCLPGVRSELSSPRHPLPADRVDVVEAMAKTVSTEMHPLSLEQARHLCRRLTEALLTSQRRAQPRVFLQVVQQILSHTTALGSDPNSWQPALSILRENLSSIPGLVDSPSARLQVLDALDQARIAIGISARDQFARHQVRQAVITYQLGQMVAQFHAAQTEAEIYGVLAHSLPLVGIECVQVAYYEPEQEDPVAWSTLQTRSDPDCPLLRFPTRTFPPPDLYPADKALSVALLPLLIQDQLWGFVALDTGNLEIAGDVVRQLSAALRSIELYREAVNGRRLAEEANRLKSRFLSMVSHELRTPLNLISGLSDMLLREGQEIEPAKYVVNWEDLERIYVNAQHLDSLIRDVLDLALNEVGQLQLAWEPLDLSEVLKAVSVIGEQLAQDKGLAWQTEIAPDLPRVWGDRTRLRQVVLNLVSNAVKFTAQGQIVLAATTEADSIRVSVQDTGLGIPKEEQAAIFDEFRQSERAAARGYGGLGLGLAICRQLIEMHGGTIGVRSGGEIGAGSTFFFTLPAIAQPPLSASTGATGPKERVVLLTKNPHAHTLLQDHLAQRGFDVKAYAQDESANLLSWLLAEPPRAVVLDLGLASEQGWQLLKALKENPATRGIPVLFGALAGDRDAGEIVEVDYLTKPVGSDELAEALLYQGLACREHGDQAAKVLVVDDEPAVLDMHARMLGMQLPGCQILRAQNGRDALRLIREEQPNLVLLDLMMPELNGFGVLEAMRERQESRHIPVIVLTGQVLTQEDMSHLNRSVTSVLQKGMLSVEETLEHIDAALDRTRRLSAETREISRRAMAYVHTHYAEPISHADVASHAGVSERHLARCFRNEMNMTVRTYLNRYRVRQAKHLLRAGDKSITEVALEVGFSNSGYFSQVFRQEAGVSPTVYRRNRA